ncbi:MAG: chromosome segregation SMC family protein [Candidatus Parvarchaeum sp.]|nr:chromosome segregation protein SMC [Candidatus Parvarchaeota archaeon]MCW1295586.1 chromosome segregation protein SMC [Candidatus Parvarchaeum tengchongense]MCW1298960.1 chromosome segregation protein SMC [Candidatus Parvarchaeum tengchongense]
MTYIKQVELDNFKSFAGHIKFDFVNGFNAIAGANGSGKSNIIDALLFVFGGSSKKEMRSDLLTDLIFNGGKSGRQAEHAKVNVILDNSKKEFHGIEENEVSISRKVDKNGKSIYRINGKASTREEVLNVLALVKFRQDGFNIIPQGRILEVVGTSNEDRLSLINDISGISVFEDKKSKAMNEMKKVEDNISKIQTVLNEKQKLMAQLEKEKTRAVEFQELKGRYASLLSKQSTIKRDAADSELQAILEKLKEAEKGNEELSEEISKLNEKVKKINEEVESINTKAEAEGEKEILEAENKAKEFDSELARLNAVLKNDNEQLNNIILSIEELSKSQEELKKQIKEEEEEKKKLEEKITTLNSRKLSLVESESKTQNYLKTKESLEKRIYDIDKKIYELKIALANYPRIAELQEELTGLEASRNDLEKTIKGMTLSFSSLKPEIDKLKIQAKREADSIYLLRENLLNQRNSLSSQNRAVEVVNRLKKDINGIYGLVSELFSLKNEEYSTPVLRSIGRRGDFIIVENEETARQCIEKLKNEKLGFYTFIPLTTVKSGYGFDKLNDQRIIDYIINLVNFDEKLAPAMKFVFGDTVLVKDFDSAKGLMHQYRMVLQDGTVFEKTGTVSGGHFDMPNILNVNKKIAEINAEISEHSKLKEEYDEEIIEKESTLNSIMTEIKVRQKNLDETKGKIAKIMQEKSKFTGTESEISESIQSLENENLNLKSKLEELDKNKPDIVDHKKEIEALEREVNDLQVKVATSGNKLSAVLMSEISNLERRFSQLNKERERFEKEIEDVENAIKDTQENYDKARKELSNKSNNLSMLRKRRSELLNELNSLQKQREAIYGNSQKVAEEINALKVKEAASRVKFETAEEEYKKYKIEGVKVEEGETLEKINREINSLNSKINSFGPINELALKTFMETQQQYEEFNVKLEKLNDERNRILSVISEIEQKKLESFMKTLSDINSIFTKVFNSITKGKAELVPEDPNNVFSSGLDISVELPNKRVRNIRGLSGGELSVLAISLIMALSKYTDAVFYVLDEVDAALDAINAGNFSALVKAYSASSQFIIISHNETTLINADVIYGVTMNDEGISRVVSVKMPEQKTQ